MYTRPEGQGPEGRIQQCSQPRKPYGPAVRTVQEPAQLDGEAGDCCQSSEPRSERPKPQTTQERRRREPEIFISRELSGFRNLGVSRRRKRAFDETASHLHVAVRIEAGGGGRSGVKTARKLRKTDMLLGARDETAMLPAETPQSPWVPCPPTLMPAWTRAATRTFLFLVPISQEGGGRPAGNKP